MAGLSKANSNLLTFEQLPFGMKNFLFFILFIALLSSCKLNPNLQGRGSDFLQGVWEQDSVPYKAQLLEYTLHKFTFTCDSFYVKLETFAKINRYSNECYNNGKWTEYAKGTYQVRQDTLFLTGTFTKENYKQKISGCYRIGQYLPVFVIKNKSEDKIELENLHQHLPVILNIKEKLSCTPKPL